MPDIVITPGSTDINSSGGTLVLRTSDAQALSLKTNNSDALYINSSGNVGIGTTTANTKLKVSGLFSQRAAGSTEMQEYKNVVTFSLDNNGTGGYVIKTPFLIGSSYEMAIVHVKGYGYGAGAIYDFKVVFYDYGPSSAPINYSLVDLGNDGTVKYLAKDSSGYVNICFGSLANTNYYFRFTVDCITTRGSGDYSQGWSMSQTASASYGMSALYSISSPVSFTQSSVGIGTISPASPLTIQSNGTHLRLETSSSPTTFYTTLRSLYDSTHPFQLAVANNNGSSAEFLGIYADSGGSNNRVVFPNGNVGIGLTGPVSPLHVFSTAATLATFTRDLATDVGFNIGADSNGTVLSTTGAHAIQIYTNSTEKVRINSDGNLGIGTTSPSYKLDVKGDCIRSFATGAVEPGFIVDYGSSNGYGAFFIHVDGSRKWRIGSVGDTNATPSLNFWQEGSGSRMFISTSGSVGIGTTSPSYKLHITGETLIKADHGTTRLQLYYPNATAAYEGYLTLWASEPGITYNCTGIGGNINIGGQYYGRATNSSTYGLYLRFNVNDGYSEFYSTTGSAGTGGGQGTRVAYFDSNGTLFSNAGGRFATNVGIGTTSPGYNLEVVSTTGQIANIRSTNAGGYTELLVSSNDRNLYIGQRSSTNSSGDLAYLYTSSSTPITFWNDGAERVRIAASTGNVGIGTTSPVGKLDVYANANAGHIGIIRNASAGSSAYTALVLRRDSDTNGIVLFTNSSTRTADGGAGNSTIRSDNGNLFLGAGGSSQHVLTTNGSLGIGTTAPSYRFDIGAGTGGSVNVRLTPGYERVRFNGVDLLGYPNESLWLISSTTYSSFVLSSANWDWDYQVEMRYTPGTIGVTAGNLILGQINKNNANFTHGITSFYTNGSEKVRINSSGNLGIGTTAPAYKLSVIGNSYFSNSIYISENGFELTARKDDITTRTACGFFETNYATTGTGWPETTNSWYHLLSSTHSNGGNYYSMQLAADFFTQKLFYRSTNSSGTGPWTRVLDATNYSYAANLNQNLRTTDSPTFSSIITGTGTGIYVGNGNISTSSRVIINFHTDADYNYLIGKRAGAWTQPMDIAFYTGIRYHAHRTYNAHIFYTTGYDSTESFSIGRNGDSHTRVNYNLLVSGSLGVGTTSPSLPFVVSNSGAQGFEINPNSGTYSGGIDILSYNRATSAYKAYGLFAEYYVWNTATTGAPSEKMRIANGGNVGIGTSTVDSTLHMYATSVAQLRIQNSERNFILTNNATDDLCSFFYDGYNRLQFDLTNQWFNTGNLGIGTTVPKFPLDNYNDSVRSSLRVAEKVIVVNFGNGVANQKVDITFDVAPGTNVFWGNFEVELTSGYSNQLSTGQLIKVFSVGLNPATGTGPYSSAIFDNVSYYKASYGEVASNWAINGISFNTTTGKYYFTVIHRTSTGNVAVIKVKSFGESSSYADNIASLTAGSVYTTDTTTYYKPVIESVAQRIGYNGNVNQTGDLIIQGSVGIGTTGPAYKLDINGVTRFQDVVRFKVDSWNLSDDGKTRFYFANNNRTYFGSQNGYEWRNASDGALGVLLNDGNLGIGTTSPSSKLHIKGTTTIENGANSSGTVRNAPVTMWTDNAFGMELHNSNSSWQTAIFGRQSDSTVLTFGSYSANETQQQNFNHYLTILNTGNVGIGTESPARKLDVVGELRFASDNIYLAGATNYIRSDNTYNFLTVAGGAQAAKFAGIQVSSSYTGTIPTDGILFGTDTNIYRSAADTLKTDDNFIANASVGIGGSTATTRVLTITNVSATDRPAIKIVNPNFYSSTSSTGRTFYRWMPIDIDGTTYWIPIYSA